MIQRDFIVAWRQQAPWPTDAQVEQDLVLSRALVEIFNHPLLSREARPEVVFNCSSKAPLVWFDGRTSCDPAISNDQRFVSNRVLRNAETGAPECFAHRERHGEPERSVAIEISKYCASVTANNLYKGWNGFVQDSELVNERPFDVGPLLAKDLNHGLGIGSIELLQEQTGTGGGYAPGLGRAQREVLEVVRNKHSRLRVCGRS